MHGRVLYTVNCEIVCKVPRPDGIEDSRGMTALDEVISTGPVDATDDVSGLALELNKVENDKLLLTQALQQGSTEWRRSKFSLLGQGRAGKTAFANAIAGRQFEDTASTVGINQLTCDVKHIQTSTSSEVEAVWGECSKHDREFEAALAEILARKKQGKGRGTISSSEGADNNLRTYMQDVTAVPAPRDVEGVAEAGGVSISDELVISGDVVTEENAPDVDTAGTVTALQPSSPAKMPSKLRSEVAEGLHPLKPRGGDHRKMTEGVNGGTVALEAVSAAKYKVDEDMVMKMLATVEDADTGLLISLFNFGGQSVFEVIHHLFLTRNGVYALVFNMEWLVTEDADKHEALRFMRNWLSSIAVHTMSKEGRTAPVVIIGTRLDVVSDGDAHDKISATLFNEFHEHLAWHSVIKNENGRDKNGRAMHVFFPVDNVVGKKDGAMKHLMSVVQGAIDKAEYTHKEVPMTWLKAIDQMSDTKKDCLTLSEVVATGKTCGVSGLEVPLMLAFLHDMGHLLWLDETGLRDVVILDPVSYLVTPATIIICKLTPDGADSVYHYMEEHGECEAAHRWEWKELTTKGLLHKVLLPILWRKNSVHIDNLLQLMVKFGLLIPLRPLTVGYVDAESTQFLVPTLLKPVAIDDPALSKWTEKPHTRFYFVFTLVQQLGTASAVTEADLKESGFLPGGTFERIMGKALSWSQDTAKGSAVNLDSVVLHKNLAVMSFGNQRFRLALCPEIHCVRVAVEGSNPVGVQQKLFGFIQRIADECMKSLHCFTAVVYRTPPAPSVHAETDPALLGLACGEVLIPLEQLRKAGSGTAALVKRGTTLLSQAEVKRNYGQWLQLHVLRKRYDLFISYRWNERDTKFTEQLFDMLTNYSVGSRDRAVEAFLDRRRLQEGQLFQVDFAAALTHSLVVMPVVSVDALQKMLKHDPEIVDNVLLEWVMLLESYQAGRVLKVYPAVFGPRSVAGLGAEETIGDFFTDPTKDALPKIAPTATVAQAAELLRKNGIEPSEKLHSYTVHSTVHSLLQFLLTQASQISGVRLVEEFAEKVVRLLQDCGDAALDSVVPDTSAHSCTAVSLQVPVSTVPQLTEVGALTPVVACGGARPLKSLSVEEVGRVLLAIEMDSLVALFAEKRVNGMLLHACEEAAELMSEDFGLTSKVKARALMGRIEEWRAGGVSLLSSTLVSSGL
jgi:GTPase SAR1 family protein